ncbi:MAG: Tm-1-like ATP-binding domain-containing protein, partial [Actinomycetota bacterium]
GREVAEKLSAATGPTALFVPLRGVSMIAVEGGPFHDPAADAALFAAVREGVGPNVELIELDLDVNDPAFSRAMADWLEARLREAGA